MAPPKASAPNRHVLLTGSPLFNRVVGYGYGPASSSAKLGSGRPAGAFKLGGFRPFGGRR